MTPDQFKNHQSVCALPWNGIFVNPDGNVSNCAVIQQPLGNINSEALPAHFFNETSIAIRTDMINGIRHKRCNACYSVEDNTGPGEENHSNRSWYKKQTLKFYKNYEIFNQPNKFEPTILDLRWRNTCNQACVYCGPDLSSLWENLLSKDSGISNTENLTRSKEYIFNNLENVKHVYLAGGEPLLMKDNEEILTRLLSIDPTIDIRINSNISNIRTPVFELLQKFENVKWTISVDSIGELFEYMRWPGNWNQFVENLLKVQQQVGDQINFNMVWCILNSVEIFDAIDHLLNIGFHENMFIVQNLNFPPQLSVLHLPEKEKSVIKNLISERMTRCNPSWWLYKSLQSMYNFLDQPAPANNFYFYRTVDRPLEPGIRGTIQFLELTDQTRGTNDGQRLFQKLYNINDSN
jgi:MoaA/NifB/PqqE/SkfB family radical SAM enzyme